MKKELKVISVFVCMLVLACLLSILTIFKKQNPKPIEYLSASWDYAYEDIEEISKASDLVALVSVVKTENTYLENDIPYSEFKVSVDTPVYHTEEGDHFTILMTGGETDDNIIQVEDDPLLEKGQEFLVFCKQNSDGTYSILGGPQGRLSYHNGRLRPLNVNEPSAKKATANSTLTAEGTDADQLIAEIKGYVAEK